jgi:hypothetical protein
MPFAGNGTVNRIRQANAIPHLCFPLLSKVIAIDSVLLPLLLESVQVRLKVQSFHVSTRAAHIENIFLPLVTDECTFVSMLLPLVQDHASIYNQ